MKKFFVLTLCLLLCVCLCACSDSGKYDKYSDLLELLEKGDYQAAKDKIDQIAGVQNDGSNSGNVLGNQTGSNGGSQADDDQNQLAKIKNVLMGEWIGKGEQTLRFFADGTCEVNGQSLQYTVELGTEYFFKEVCIYLGGSKETAAASMKLCVVENNAFVSAAEKISDDANCRLLADQKGTLLTADQYYDMDHMQRVEITADNWEQYFELKEIASVFKNGFGEIDRFEVRFYFQVKESYRNRVYSTLSSGTVGTMQKTSMASCTITDMEKGSYKLGRVDNDMDLAEVVDDFKTLNDGLYGAQVAAATMFCADGSGYNPATATGRLLGWPDQLSVNRVSGILYLKK